MLIGVREHVEIWYLFMKFFRQEGSGGDFESGMKWRCNFSQAACGLSSEVNLCKYCDSSKVRFVSEPCGLQ